MSAKSKPGTNKLKREATGSMVNPANSNGTTIVAMGASAGGIEALKDLIGHLPTDTGMSFVVVQNLDPQHHSILAELFPKKTAMSVAETSDGMEAKPNHIHVVAPNTKISISGNTLRLGPRELSRGMHMPIDHEGKGVSSNRRGTGRFRLRRNAGHWRNPGAWWSNVCAGGIFGEICKHAAKRHCCRVRGLRAQPRKYCNGIGTHRAAFLY
jgi:chemotaxis response regulator CheB